MESVLVAPLCASQHFLTVFSFFSFLLFWPLAAPFHHSSCGLDDKVHHLGGDFMKISQHLQKAGYDAIVSWLTVLHFENRAKLFRQCYEVSEKWEW